MTRFLSGLSLFLFCCSVYAQTAAANAPEEPVASPMGLIIFGVLFVGFCVGFIWMVYSADKKKTKQGKAESHPASGKTT